MTSMGILQSAFIAISMRLHPKSSYNDASGLSYPCPELQK
jgi:hypothetical protein